MSQISWSDCAWEPSVRRPEHGQTGEAFLCALCGLSFTHGGRVCAACPLSGGCDLVKCPNCGYQFPRPPRWVGALSGLWRRIARSKS